MDQSIQHVKNFVGIDISKRTMEVIRVRDGMKNQRYKVSTDAEGEGRLVRWLQKEDTVIMEAGSQAFRIAKRIRKEGFTVEILNPGDVATIYRSL